MGTSFLGDHRSSRRSPRDIARLGMLLALATAIHTFEAQLPALPLPGARIGLANVVSLLALYSFGVREAFLLVILRQIAGSIFIGTFLSPAFFFGLAGGLLSVVVMAAALSIYRTASPVMVSLLGAAAHNVGQLLVAWWLTGQGVVVFYLPYLLWFSLPAGAIVGRLLELLVPYLKASNIWSHRREIHLQKRRGFELGVGGAIAVVGIVLAVVLAQGVQPTQQAEAVVRVDGEEVLRLPLDEPHTEEILPLGGRMVIETDGGRVRVKFSTCPHQVCVRTGWISSIRQGIVCIPYKTIVTIEGHAEEDPYHDIDGITQ